MLAPVFAFYLLRDRRRVADWLLSLLPPGRREMIVRIVREMGRESVGYLRGQLLVSLAVGGFTGLGLLLCGVPSWLLLGLLMGILELIPYVGPFLGGVLVALFAWPGRGRCGRAAGHPSGAVCQGRPAGHPAQTAGRTV